MKNFRWWSMIGLGLIATLQGCGSGGGSDGSGQLRLVNATLTHSSIDLVKSSDSSDVVSATAVNTASGYVDFGSSDSTGLQVNDAGTSSPIATTSSKLQEGKLYSLVAYESNGSVLTAQILEDADDPSEGNAILRMYDFGVDAGSLDVYVTQNVDDLANASVSFSIVAATTVQATGYKAFTKGTYRVRVTGSGNKSDIRLDIPSVTLDDQEIATVLLTPTKGGILLNGSVLVQNGGYSATPSTSARVRLAAAAAGNASVTATAGGIDIAPGAQAPSVGPYVTVPAGSALSVKVNGATVAAPSGGLLVGTDSTLLVYDKPADGGAHSATLIADDNHLSTTTSNYKMRLVNGITGETSNLTLRAGATLLASNVQPGVASSYGTAVGNTGNGTTVLTVSSPTEASLYQSPAQTIAGAAVYTLFVFGTLDAPYPLFVQDSVVAVSQ